MREKRSTRWWAEADILHLAGQRSLCDTQVTLPSWDSPIAHPTVVSPSEALTDPKPFQLLPIWSRLTCGNANTFICTPGSQSSHWHQGHTPLCPWSYSRGWHWFLFTLLPLVAGKKTHGQFCPMMWLQSLPSRPSQTPLPHTKRRIPHPGKGLERLLVRRQTDEEQVMAREAHMQPDLLFPPAFPTLIPPQII